MTSDVSDPGILEGFTPPISFTDDAIDQAEEREGVHVIWSDGELIFVGQSAQTRTRLRQHFTAGRAGSVLHKQIGDLLDQKLGRQATKQEIGDWLRDCTVAWKYDSHPAALKAKLMNEFNPRFNTVVPAIDRGDQTTQPSPTTVTSDLDEEDLIRETLDLIVYEYRESGVRDEFASREAWLANADAISAAIEELAATQDLAAFSRALAGLPNPPDWFKRGAHRTFIGTLANRAEDPEAASVVAEAFSVPVDQRDADDKISRLYQLAESVDRLYPGAGFAPLAASAMWSFVDPDEWPWLHPEAEPALQILRFLPRYLEGAERYRLFRHLILVATAPPPEVLAALARAAHVGSRSLSNSIYQRLRVNSQLLQNWYGDESYDSDASSELAGRNIEVVLGELDLFAKGMNEEIADKLVRELVTSKTGSRVGNELRHPFRADGYAIFTIEKNMTLPAIRVWATPSGLAIGAHYGQRKYDEAEEMARELAAELSSGMEFFEIRPHKEGDRLRPAGRQPIRGELFVGRWFEGGLTGTEVADRTIESVVALQSVFDHMVRSVGELPGTADTDDELATLYEEFIEATGYPTETDRTNKAEREEMESVISEDGLLGFDLHEFRRIFNTARYGSPRSTIHSQRLS